MNKSYSINGKVYNFTDVSMECGMLYGKCTTPPHNNEWAWLDPYGVQFEHQRRIAATEIFHFDTATLNPRDYHYWGGELRNNAEWRKKW